MTEGKSEYNTRILISRANNGYVITNPDRTDPLWREDTFIAYNLADVFARIEMLFRKSRESRYK